jgi:hypothetical protein
MKRFATVLCAALTFVPSGNLARADWGSCQYGGQQPWWNVFAHRSHCGMTCEEERLQRFWHDYYDALGHYYKALDHIDWVAYYKNHGYMINANCNGMGPNGPCGGPQRIQFAPVFVSPQMQWAVPSSCLNGAPTGQMGGGPMMPTGY